MTKGNKTIVLSGMPRMGKMEELNERWIDRGVALLRRGNF